MGSDGVRDGSTHRGPAAHPPAGLGWAAARRSGAPRPEIPTASSSWVLQTERDASEIGGGFRKDVFLSSDAVTPDEQQVIDKYHRHLRQLSMSLHGKPDPLHSITVFYDGSASRWTVGLSGSGNAYGSAGAIQMALAPQRMTLREVLARTSLALSSSPFLSIDALTGGRPAPPPAPSAVERERVARALGAAMHMNSSRILTLVDVPDADPMTALQWMAQTVPERLCQTAWWSTALLLNNPSSSRRIIATPWPQALAQRHPKEKALVDDNVYAADPSTDAAERGLLQWYTGLVLGAGGGAAIRDIAETAFLNACGSGTAPTQWDALAPVWLASIDQARPLNDDEIARVINGEDDGSLLRRWTDECAERAVGWENAIPALVGHAEPAVSSSAIRALEGSQTGFAHLCQWQAEEIARAALSAGPPAGIETGYGAAPGDSARAGGRGIEAPRALLSLQDKSVLVGEVLRRLRAFKDAPPDAWAPQAESWIRSLGLRPRDFNAHLPLTADRAMERFAAAPYDLSPIMTVVNNSVSREAALDVMLRASQVAPSQQGALLSALHDNPPQRDLNWRILLNRLIPNDTRLADVPGRLDALNESLPDGSDEFRHEIVTELLRRRGTEMLARVASDQTGAGRDAAIALLAFAVNEHYQAPGPREEAGAGSDRVLEWIWSQRKWLAIAIAVVTAIVVIVFIAQTLSN